MDCTALHPLLQQRIAPCVRAVLAAGCSWRSHEYTLPAQQHTRAPDSNPRGFCSHAGFENLLPKLVERPWFIHMCVRPCPRQPVDLTEMVNTLDTIDDTSDPIDLLLRQFNNIPVCRCTLLPNLLASKPDGKSGTSIAKADKPRLVRGSVVNDLCGHCFRILRCEAEWIVFVREPGNHQLFKRVRQRAPLCAQGQVNTIHHLDCVGHAWCLVAARSTPGRYTDVNLLHMSLKVCRLEVGTWWRHLHIVSCLSAFLALVPGLPAGLPACCVDCVVTARAVVPLIVFCTAFGPATAAFGPWPWTMKNEMLRCP